jgi:hypothetical protein
MKLAIQGLGEVPTTVLLVLRREKPEVTHVICSDYQYKYVAKDAGFDTPNGRVIREAANKLGIKIVFHRCDAFDPSKVGEILGGIIDKLDPERDELIINYTGGTAVVRLLLGTLGILISAVVKTKLLYAIKYPDGVEILADHSQILRELHQVWIVKKREIGIPRGLRVSHARTIKLLKEQFAALSRSAPIIEAYKEFFPRKKKRVVKKSKRKSGHA